MRSALADLTWDSQILSEAPTGWPVPFSRGGCCLTGEGQRLAAVPTRTLTRRFVILSGLVGGRDGIGDLETSW